MKYAVIVLVCLIVAGCATVGPDYKRPALALQSEFDDAGGQVRSDKIRPDWWAVFGDAQLVGYTRDAVKNNHDLKVAHARIREARAIRRNVRSRFQPGIGFGSSYDAFEFSHNGPTGSQGLAGIDDDLFEAGAVWDSPQDSCP